MTAEGFDDAVRARPRQSPQRDAAVAAAGANDEILFIVAPRRDLPEKVFGQPRLIHDLALPGMAHGRVVRPSAPGARLEDTRVTTDAIVAIQDMGAAGLTCSAVEMGAKGDLGVELDHVGRPPVGDHPAAAQVALRLVARPLGLGHLVLPHIERRGVESKDLCQPRDGSDLRLGQPVRTDRREGVLKRCKIRKEFLRPLVARRRGHRPSSRSRAQAPASPRAKARRARGGAAPRCGPRAPAS